MIKTKLANILSNQDESDVAFDVGVACICQEADMIGKITSESVIA
jgi:hypothetical protein